MKSEKTVHAFNNGNCKTKFDYTTSQEMAVYVIANTLASICKMPGLVVRVHRYSNTWNNIDLKHLTSYIFTFTGVYLDMPFFRTAK